jgi:hypothetical protein
MKRELLYAKESDLCADFIAWSAKHGWTAYAETAGWDIVLVRPSGVQIGVQAKLRFNTKVLAQTLPHYFDDDVVGPDYRAVLVGSPFDGCHLIGDALGIVIFYPNSHAQRSYSREEFTGDSEFIENTDIRSFYRFGSKWFDWNPTKRIKLPDYVPDVAAGASGPVQLTPWKIGALRLTALLELRGYITRKDFRDHGINPTRWHIFGNSDRSWVIPGSERGQWVRGPALHFDQQHPINYQQIKSEVAKTLEQERARVG